MVRAPSWNGESRRIQVHSIGHGIIYFVTGTVASVYKHDQSPSCMPSEAGVSPIYDPEVEAVAKISETAESISRTVSISNELVERAFQSSDSAAWCA